MSGRTSRRPVSLTLRTATLFALVAALVVSGTGGYLFSAMRQEMTLRSDLQVTGRVEYLPIIAAETILQPPMKVVRSAAQN